MHLHLGYIGRFWYVTPDKKKSCWVRLDPDALERRVCDRASFYMHIFPSAEMIRYPPNRHPNVRYSRTL